eukprot:143208-Rhodomonas_salina.4
MLWFLVWASAGHASVIPGRDIPYVLYCVLRALYRDALGMRYAMCGTDVGYAATRRKKEAELVHGVRRYWPTRALGDARY